MENGFLPVLDLYEHYRDGEMSLTGAFGGVKIFTCPIKGAHPGRSVVAHVLRTAPARL
jgi:hypothetical protein